MWHLSFQKQAANHGNFKKDCVMDNFLEESDSGLLRRPEPELKSSVQGKVFIGILVGCRSG